MNQDLHWTNESIYWLYSFKHVSLNSEFFFVMKVHIKREKGQISESYAFRVHFKSKNIAFQFIFFT